MEARRAGRRSRRRASRRSVSSIASAASPGEAAPAAARFLAEIDVVVDGRVAGIRLHVRARVQVALPGLDRGAGGGGRGERGDYGELHEAGFQGTGSFRSCTIS